MFDKVLGRCPSVGALKNTTRDLYFSRQNFQIGVINGLVLFLVSLPLLDICTKLLPKATGIQHVARALVNITS